jgi:uncharacterized protein (TIRG00374 family)
MSAALWVIAVLLLIRTAGQIGWGVLADRLERAEPSLLALTLVITLLRYVAWGKRWQILVRSVEPIPWWPAQKALMASLFITTVVPGSRPFGGLIRARRLARELHRPTGLLYGGALVDQIGYGVVSMALGAIYLPLAFWVDPSHSSGDRVLLWVAGVAGLLLAFLVMWRRRTFLLARIRSRMPRVAVSLEETFGCARRLLARPDTWRVVAVGGGIVWLANVLTFQVASAALGYSLSFAAAAAAFAVGSLAGTLTGTPGGAGTTELAALAPLIALGIPTDVALSAVLLARGAHYLCSILIGGIIALRPPRPDPAPAVAGSADA